MPSPQKRLDIADGSAAAKRPELAVLITGQGPSFALFHGGFGSHSHWIRNIDALASQFRVLAFDSPGYGDSPDVPPEITPEGYVDWVAGALAAATPDGTHLAGFSFGGALAAQVAARLGKHIKRLSLLGPGGFGIPVGRSIPIARLPEPDEADLKTRLAVVAANLGQWMLSSAPPADDPVVKLQLDNISGTRFDSRRVSMRKTIFEDLARITAPVQIIWGRADKLAYPSIESRTESCRKVRPDLRTAVVPGGGHWIQYEQADAVNRLLLNFHSEQT
jgi:2-hydroxy-6-oxonona-2,4-dienedioate hydrolase